MNFLRFATTPLLAAALLLSTASSYNAPVASTSTSEQAAHSKKPVAFHYVCPMHPDVKSNKPGKCPKCKMRLEKKPVKEPSETPSQ